MPSTIRSFVDQQLLLTIFLVVLLWSLHIRLRKQAFFQWWAWAWTSFAGYLSLGALALRLGPEWTFFKGSLVLASLVCGLLQVPLLTFGARAWRRHGNPRRMWFVVGIAVAVTASALIFAAALYCREKPLTSFAVRTVPRTLAIAASLFFCAWVFIGQWRKNRSLAAIITGGFCSLYALDQSFYSLIYINQLVSSLSPPFSLLSFTLLLSPLPFFLDLVFEFGICLGIVLLLVEEHERTELAFSRLIQAQEQERARIAGKLDDDIVQRLGLLAIEMEHFQQQSSTLPTEVRSHLDKLWKQTSGIATDILSLSHELHLSELEYLGLAAVMKRFCKQFGEEQKVEIDFRADDLPSPLMPAISLCLFRILQEALHNAEEHSGVVHFKVRLWATSSEIHLTISDLGVGFDKEAARESGGLGLISMEERLKLLDGTFSIESQPKRGTTIRARVPLSSGSESAYAPS